MCPVGGTEALLSFRSALLRQMSLDLHLLLFRHVWAGRTGREHSGRPVRRGNDLVHRLMRLTMQTHLYDVGT